jgi:FtsH-binding integral membrane protein
MDKMKTSLVIRLSPNFSLCLLTSECKWWCYFYVHFLSFSGSSSCFEEFQVDLLTFIIIFLYTFTEKQESSALYGGVIGGVVGVIIISMIIKSNPSKIT